MKIIPLYLPQFHSIPENDEWWGKGFTEWVNMKSAQPLFEGHYQPRIPLNHNYYDLSDVETLKWQCKIAKDHGIYGFCMYHYWFNGHLLLEKPMEMLLAHPEIDIRYCVSWANHPWTDAWKATDGHVKTLISLDYDDEEDWVKHFEYLLPFFKDPRYMQEDNKPLMVIYMPHSIKKLNKMLDLWTKMAREAGFDGLKYIYQSQFACFDTSWDRSRFDYGIQFHPGYIFHNARGASKEWLRNCIFKLGSSVKKMIGIKQSLRPISKEVKTRDYDEDWQAILRLRPENDRMLPSAMVDWDNTPRKKKAGWAYRNASPEKFKKYFKQLILNTKEYYKQDKIFVFAWNEWAEGGYLEPDEKFKYGYLEAIRDSLKETNSEEI